MTLTGPSLPPRSGGKAKQLVVILHGWGADGANLIDLAELYAQKLPHAHFIAPNAPEVCEVNPYGFQWFSLNDRSPAALLSGVRRAADTLNAALDTTLAEMGLSNKDLALVGFSQGTMLALHAGLRRTPQIACILGYSGMLVGPEALAAEITAKPPISLIHGQYDEVVPYASMGTAKAALEAAGVSAQTHTRPFLGHSIDMEGIQAGSEFLSKHLG